MKTCVRCRKRRQGRSFRKKTKSPDGLQAWCKDCAKPRHKAHYGRRRRKQRFVRDKKKGELRVKLRRLKESKPCSDCKRKYPACVMDFDHRDPRKKKYNVGQMIWDSYGWSTILKEIAKCDLVCSNCHRIRTHLK